jgi:zinc transporter ZupT
MSSLETLITLIVSSSALPFLAFLAIILRRKVVSGTLKNFVLFASTFGLLFVVVNEYVHHRAEFGVHDLFIGISVSLITFLVLSKSGHHHKHEIEESGIRGIVLAEAFHSIFDGLTIGVTFLVTPLLGLGATFGILVHEIPKMIATLALFRSLNLSLRKTIVYGVLSQIGAPVSALLVYLCGVTLETEFHGGDMAIIASLATIVLYILFLEVKHHVRKDKHHHH